MRLRMVNRVQSADDAGFGMIMVIGVMSVVTAMMIVGTTMADRSLKSSRTHVSFEGAVAAAENGIDTGLARAQETYDQLGTDSYFYPSTSEPTCPIDTPDWNAAGAPGSLGSPAAQQAAEREWAKGVLETIATTASCRIHSNQGDYVFFKPRNHATVYSMAWSPGYGANEARMRYLKAEYLFTPYAPTHAVLTSGDLHIASSTTVTTAGSHDPTLAAVHSNGSVTSQGNPTVTGPVTQSGTGSLAGSNNFPGGQVTTTVKQRVPTASAASVWGRQHGGAFPGGWYDLCPDGTVRSPDGSSPCTGTVVGSNSFRGWSFDGSGTVPVWTATSGVASNGGYSGVYYVHGGDIKQGNGNGEVPNMTLIAAAANTGCNKVGGNISWDHISLKAPAVPNLFMLADQDILTTSNFQAGYEVTSAGVTTVVSGLFVAGDQIELQTSSAGAYGAVVASDGCDPSGSLVDANVVKNPEIYYDPNGQAPFIDIVNTTLWLEFAG